MLSNESLANLRGVKQLLDDTFEAGLDATERLHLEIASRPYRLLEKIDAIARPVHAIGALQSGITHGVYAAIRGVHQIGSGLADKAIALVNAKQTTRSD